MINKKLTTIDKVSHKLVGRVEKVGLPEFKTIGLRAKIDTGAYSVAIHAHNIKVDNDELVFTILDPEHIKYKSIEMRTKDFKIKNIRSSNGELQSRYSIITKLKIGDELYEVEATLADRKSMKYPILIGRKFLRKNGFLVDVNSTYLQKKI